jgi:hypothetical protein
MFDATASSLGHKNISCYGFIKLCHFIQNVSEIYDTNVGVCSVHKNNEESLCKFESLYASSFTYGPFYFGRRRLENEE